MSLREQAPYVLHQIAQSAGLWVFCLAALAAVSVGLRVCDALLSDGRA